MAEPEQLIEQCDGEEREEILFAAYYVAFADGRFWREKPLLDRICGELDVPGKTAHRLKNRAARRPTKLTLPDSQAARQLAYHYALAVAASDGKLTGRERQIAEMLGSHLELSEEEIAAELDASLGAEEAKPGQRRRSRRKGPEVAKPYNGQRALSKEKGVKTDNCPVMLAGLVGRESEAAAPGLAYLKSPTAIATVLGNLVPVFGVWLFDWEVFNVVFLYWLEAVVMAVFMVLKTALFVLLYYEDDPGGVPKEPLRARVGPCLILASVFACGYGIPLFIYRHFLFELFPRNDSAWSPVMVVALAALFAEYCFFFLYDYVGKRKYLATDPPSLTLQISSRMTVLQSAIILGTVLLDAFSLPTGFLIVLICLKTGLDLRLIYRNPMLFSP